MLRADLASGPCRCWDRRLCGARFARSLHSRTCLKCKLKSPSLMASRKLFVTTALPYANGPFHIGHIMEYIQADIWVRFQRMQGHEVHFVGADDAHGAPIMLAAEKAGKSPEAFIDAIQKGRKPYLDGFHISYDNWHSTHSPENTELSQDIYRRLKAAGLVYTQAGRAVLRPGEGHVPRRPLHQGRVPELRREGPVRRRLRELQHGLLRHRAEEPLLDAVGREAGAQVLAALLLQALRSEVQGVHPANGWRRPAGCSPRSSTRPRNGWTGPATRRSPTGTSRATRPTSASASPTSRKRSTSTSGSTRRSAIWHR